MTDPASDPAWAASMAELLATPSPAEALARRDALAARDGGRLVQALAGVVGAGSAPTSDRISAAWLLKDLADARAAPALESALLSAPAGSQLRLQILDTLERAAFGDPDALARALDLPRLAVAVSHPSERRPLIALLASIGSEEARQILRRMAVDPGARVQLVEEVAPRPDAWIDGLFADVAADAGPGGAREIEAAIAERAHQALQARLSDPAGTEPVGEPVLRELWNARDLALIADLAERGRLDAAAAAFLIGLDAAAGIDGLSKSQRKLLARARAALALGALLR